MHRIVLTLALLSLGFALPPFPKADRHAAPLTMAGTWEGDWAGWPVRLDFHANGSARFEYTKIQGPFDGSWKSDGGRKVTLTLQFADAASQDYVLAFSVLGRDVAVGKILDSQAASRPLKLKRAAGK